MNFVLLVRQNKKYKNIRLLIASLGLTTLGATTINTKNVQFSSIIQAVNNFKPVIVHAAEVTSIPTHTYGVDVSSYNNTDLTQYAQQGAKYSIVKLSEGTSYVNPKAQGQISSAKQNNMFVQGYHYAIFGSNVQQAHQEAQYAIQHAQQLGLAKGSYLACDYESTNNNPSNDKNANTQAVLAFMHDIANAGYQPLAYSSASFFNQYLNKAQIIAQFPNSLWVAAYPNGSNAVDHANFNYFPSTEGVVQWQFTDNKNGMHVDGDINVLPMQNKGAVINNSQQQQNVENNAEANKPIAYGTESQSNIKGDGTPIGQHTNAKNVVNHQPTNISNANKVAQNGSQSQLKGNTITKNQIPSKNSSNTITVSNKGSNNLAQTSSPNNKNNSTFGLLIAGTTLTGIGLINPKKKLI